MHNTPLHSQDKGSHDTVHPFTGLVNFPRKARSPPTSLGDVRQHNGHLRETPIEMLPILRRDRCSSCIPSRSRRSESAGHPGLLFLWGTSRRKEGVRAIEVHPSQTSKPWPLGQDWPRWSLWPSLPHDECSYSRWSKSLDLLIAYSNHNQNTVLSVWVNRF